MPGNTFGPLCHLGPQGRMEMQALEPAESRDSSQETFAKAFSTVLRSFGEFSS